MKRSGTVIIILFLAFTFLISCNSTGGKKQDVKMSDSLKFDVSRNFKRSDYDVLKNYRTSLNTLIDSLHVDYKELSIEIDKSDYILAVVFDTLVLKQYPIVLGANPIDDKLYEGDKCTPEGTFKIMAKYEHELWNRFIKIDYPNSESLLKIKLARENGLIPAESTPGGGIGIHGVYSGCDYFIDFRVNWTLGCISMKNDEIIEIFNNVAIGTLVSISK